MPPPCAWLSGRTWEHVRLSTRLGSKAKAPSLFWFPPLCHSCRAPTVLTVPTTWSLKIIHNKTLNSLTSKKLKATSATSSRGLTTRRSLTTSPSIWRAHLSPHVSVYSKSRTGLPTLPGPSGKREENAESREINTAPVPYPKCVQSNVSDRKEVFPPLNIWKLQFCFKQLYHPQLLWLSQVRK